jgi:hypothetical protein
MALPTRLRARGAIATSITSFAELRAHALSDRQVTLSAETPPQSCQAVERPGGTGVAPAGQRASVDPGQSRHCTVGPNRAAGQRLSARGRRQRQRIHRRRHYEPICVRTGGWRCTPSQTALGADLRLGCGSGGWCRECAGNVYVSDDTFPGTVWALGPTSTAPSKLPISPTTRAT